MIQTVTHMAFLPHMALVTINNIPNTTENLAKILGEISFRKVAVDMISRTAPYKDTFTLSFTVPQENLADVVGATALFKTLGPGITTDVNGNNTKVILSGDGMRDTYGVAAELFRLLADSDIPVKLITTAETEISCLVDIKDVERVKELLKN